MEVASDKIIQGWKSEIVDKKILRIERVENCEDEDDEQGDHAGWDSLINTNHDENYVISLSTDREEICVWNVLK